MNRRTRVRWLLLLAASVGGGACAVTDTTQFYTLGQPVAGITASSPSASPGSGVPEKRTMSIGVGPVFMPGYLDRGQIVSRTGADQVELSMFHRWAEPLEDGITRILAEEISARVPTQRVVTFPWRGGVARTLQYQVVVTVGRFDGRQGGDVILDTRWRILGKDRDELAFRRSTITEAASGKGFEPLVAAMTRALVTLGQEIATEIRTMPPLR